TPRNTPTYAARPRPPTGTTAEPGDRPSRSGCRTLWLRSSRRAPLPRRRSPGGRATAGRRVVRRTRRTRRGRRAGSWPRRTRTYVRTSRPDEKGLSVPVHPRDGVGRQRLVTDVLERRQLFGCEHVAPTTVGALVEERVGTTDEVRVEIGDLGTPSLHGREHARLDDDRPRRLVDVDHQEFADAAHLAVD